MSQRNQPYHALDMTIFVRRISSCCFWSSDVICLELYPLNAIIKSTLAADKSSIKLSDLNYVSGLNKLFCCGDYLIRKQSTVVRRRARLTL